MVLTVRTSSPTNRYRSVETTCYRAFRLPAKSLCGINCVLAPGKLDLGGENVNATFALRRRQWCLSLWSGLVGSAEVLVVRELGFTIVT